MLKKNNVIILLLAISVLFCCMLGISGYNNRLAEDDFAFLDAVRQQGIVNASMQNFHSWNSRLASLFLVNTVFSALRLSSSLLPYLILETSCLFLALFFLFSNVSIFFRITLEKKFIFLYTILFCCGFFYTTFDKGEAWFWVTGSSIYLWSISFASLGAGCILNKSKNIFILFPLLLSGFYIGGSSEVFAVVLLMISFCSFLFLVRQKKYKQFFLLKIIAFSLAIATTLFIAYFAQGTETRRAALPHPGFISQQWIFLKSIAKLWIFYLPGKIPVAILFGIPWLYAGMTAGNPGNFTSISKLFSLKNFILLFVVLTCISIYPVVHILSEQGPARSWTQISFYLSLLSSAFFFYTGLTLNKNSPVIKIIPVSLILLVVLLGFDSGMQYVITKKYAAAWDQRMDYLDSLKKVSCPPIVELEPLPPGGYLHSAEINADPLYFSNRQMQSALQLPFEIRLKEKK